MSADFPARDWYYTKSSSGSGQQGGPLSWEQLRSLAATGVITPAAMVWHASLPQWLPAGQIAGLLQQPAYHQPFPSPQMPPGAYGAQPRRGWVLPLVISLAILVLAGAGLGIYFGVIRDNDKTEADGTATSIVAKTTTTATGSTATTLTTITATPATTAC